MCDNRERLNPSSPANSPMDSWGFSFSSLSTCVSRQSEKGMRESPMLEDSFCIWCFWGDLSRRVVEVPMLASLAFTSVLNGPIRDVNSVRIDSDELARTIAQATVRVFLIPKLGTVR